MSDELDGQAVLENHMGPPRRSPPRPMYFHADALYTQDQLQEFLGSGSSRRLLEARLAGELHFRRIGGRPVYLGANVLKWLAGTDEQKPQPRSPRKKGSTTSGGEAVKVDD